MTTIPVHLLVPAPVAEDVLVEQSVPAAPRLPSIELTLRDGETVVSALRSALEDAWGFPPSVLETHLQPPPGTADELVALAVLQSPPSTWSPPNGLSWGPAPATLPAHVGERASTWLAEWAGDLAVAEHRPRWARPGWHERALAWIDEALASAGRRRSGAPDVRRSWTLAAVHRIGLEGGGDAWFKAVFPSFGHEPSVTRHLHAMRPAWVPAPIAIEPDEGWLLLETVPGTELGPRATEADAIAAVGRLVALGIEAAADTDRLVELGCPRRPIARLADDLDAALADAASLEGPELTSDERRRAVDWVARAARWLAGASLPETLVHGDFTVFNLFGTPDGPVIIDWSDAAISHPLVDIGPLVDHPAAALDPGRILDAWLDALAPYGNVEHLRGGPDRILGLSAAYELVSYAGILRRVEPANRYQVSDGFRGFWELLDRHAG